MGETIRIYLRLVSAQIRSQAQYRASFLLQIAGTFLMSFVDFLGILVIFGHLSNLAGWRLEEIAFLYGSSYVSFKLTDLVAGQLDLLPDYMRTGRFDSFLVRPLGSLFQMACSDFSLRHLGGAIQGGLVLGLALASNDIHWTPGRVLLLLVMLVSGAFIFGGVWVVANAIAFWITDTREVANAFTYGGNELTQYPLHIFGAWLRRLVLFVVPLSFVNYFPSLYILGKADPLRLPRGLSFVAPLVAVTFCLVAARVWLLGVRSYRSTGS